MGNHTDDTRKQVTPAATGKPDALDSNASTGNLGVTDTQGNQPDTNKQGAQDISGKQGEQAVPGAKFTPGTPSNK